jgi:hypothetical protein
MSSNKRKTCDNVDGDNGNDDDAMNGNSDNAMITKCNNAQAVHALLQERFEAKQRLDDIDRRLVATQYASQCFSRYIDIRRRRADCDCPAASSSSAQEICVMHHDHDRGTISHNDNDNKFNNAMFWKFRHELAGEQEHDAESIVSRSIQLLNRCLGDYGLAVDLEFPMLMDHCGFSNCHYDQLRVCRPASSVSLSTAPNDNNTLSPSSKQAATKSSLSSSSLFITVTGAALEAINGTYYECECITDDEGVGVGRMDGVSKFLAHHRSYMGHDDTTFTMHRCTTWDGGKEWIISILADDNTNNNTPICENGADFDFFKATGTTAAESKPSGNGEAFQNRIKSHGSHLPPPSGWGAISKSHTTTVITTSTKEQQSQLIVDASLFCPVCRPRTTQRL